MRGYAGKILRIDLSDRHSTATSHWLTEKYAQWVGGHGMGSALFYDIAVREKGLDLSAVDGFDPDNVVTLMTSPLCGSGVPGASARTEVQGIGVQSHPIGWFTRSNFGGRFAALLKSAGWDGIAILGKADRPVWIDIRDEHVAIRDCSELDLWGTDTWEAQRIIWKYVAADRDYGKWRQPAGALNPSTQRPAVLTIGPAGENQSRLGALIHDAGNGAGQGGFGGVWGSKNLKAISVIGTGDIDIADPKALMQARLHQKANYQAVLGDPRCEPTFPSFGHWVPAGPGLNWTLGKPREGHRPQACVGCHAACRARWEKGPGNEAKCFATAFYLDGRTLEIQRRASDLVNLYGLNVVELIGGLAYLKALNAEGLLGTGPGKIECPLDFDDLGTLEFLEQLVKAFSYKDDGRGNPSEFGAAIAEGVFRAAEKWGRLEQDTATGMLAYPHWGIPVHFDPRYQLEWGYGSILGDRDANEHDFDFLHWNPTQALQMGDSPLAPAEDAVRIYTDKMQPYHRDPDRMRMLDYSTENMYSEHMAKLVLWHRHYTRFWKQSALFCDWQWPDFINPYGPDMVGSTGDQGEAKFLKAVTGRDMSFADGMELGRKVWNLDHAIWTLQGRTREMVHFAEYIYREPHGETGTVGGHYVPCLVDGQWQYFNVGATKRSMDRQAFEEFKTRFYRLAGWDPTTGYPTARVAQELEELGVEGITGELSSRNKLGTDEGET